MSNNEGVLAERIKAIASGDLATSLKKLSDLRYERVISDEEFQQLKQHLLGSSEAESSASDNPLELEVSVMDIFSIKGRGTVAVGKLMSGRVAVGDEVRLSRKGEVVAKLIVQGIEARHKQHQSVEFESKPIDIGVLFDSPKELFVRGDYIVG